MSKLIYGPIYHEAGKPGSERSDHVKKWVDNFLIPSGRATLDKNLNNAYLVATGDSGLMKVARTHYNDNKILVGVNCGTLGFLLNPIVDINDIPVDTDDLDLIKLKLIHGKFFSKDGSKKEFLIFNDIVCGKGVADFIDFQITGSLSHFPNRKVSGTGVFVSTAQGATGYAIRARGTAALLQLDAREWFIGGVATGPYPCDPVSPQVITIEMKSRCAINGYADGHSQVVEDIYKVVITPTNYEVTLGFLKGIDFPARRTALAQKVERGEY